MSESLKVAKFSTSDWVMHPLPTRNTPPSGSNYYAKQSAVTKRKSSQLGLLSECFIFFALHNFTCFLLRHAVYVDYLCL